MLEVVGVVADGDGRPLLLLLYPSRFGEWPLAVGVVPPGVRGMAVGEHGSCVSDGADNEPRVSNEKKRRGVSSRGIWKFDDSVADVVRPSGPNARICGDELR